MITLSMKVRFIILIPMLLVIAVVCVSIAVVCVSMSWPLETFLALCVWALPVTMILSLPQVANKKFLVVVAGYFRRDLRPVVLYFYTGCEKPQYSLARFTNNHWQCPVYWVADIGKCILLPNGLVAPSSESNYILYWRPLRKTELMMHLFTEVEHVWGVEGINRHH